MPKYQVDYKYTEHATAIIDAPTAADAEYQIENDESDLVEDFKIENCEEVIL